MASESKIIEHPVKPSGAAGAELFDNRVKISDVLTGRMIRYQPFAQHTFGDDKKTIFERPIGSGNMWDEKGVAIGRWEVSSNGKWAKVAEEHIKTKPMPVNEREAMMNELEETKAELEALKAENETREKTKVSKKN